MLSAPDLAAQPWRHHYPADTPQQFDSLPDPHIPAMVRRVAAQYAAQAAFTVVMPNGIHGSLTYAQIDHLSDQFAAYLRETLQLKVGDRVAVQLPNCLAYPVAVFGILKAGCALVNTNPMYTPAEMTHQFNDSGAKALVVVDLFGDKAAAVMSKTSLKHLIMVSLADFVPALPAAIVRFALKYWSRQVPVCAAPHTAFTTALAQGEAALKAGTNVVAYTADLLPDDMAALQYTGGTTGVSKGAVLTHHNLLANIHQMHEVVRSKIEPGKECALCVLPLYHIFAFTANMLYFFWQGGRTVLVPNPRPLSNVMRAIENYPITWIPGVNTLFNGLLNEDWFRDYPPPTLKACVAGGTSLHPAVAERWEKVTRTAILEGYGLTESSPVVTFNLMGKPPRSGSIGVPLPGTEVKLVNEAGELAAPGEPGELAVRGPQVMAGYWQRPEETANVLKDGWLYTGDVAVMDADGYFRIVDRKKDLVLVSGFNVYPNEVEACIAQMAGVKEVAVIGVPDPQTGEAVRAYVVPTEPGQLTAEQVRAHCKQQLTGYKVPKQVEFRIDLPKTPVGKVLRKDLRAEALRHQAVN